MGDYVPFEVKTQRAKALSGANYGEGSEFREFCEFLPADQKTGLDCQLTVLTNDQGYATKIFDLDGCGKLQKRSAANIYEGKARRISIKGLVQLRDILGQLEPNQALCFGVPEPEEARLLTQETLRSGSFPDALARDREHFSFRKGQPGVLMLDYDPREGDPAFDWQEIDRIIAEIIPSWDQTERLWKASSSAFTYTNEGVELIGKGGWRCYVMVDDASAIPAVGAFLYEGLWERGHGYILISQSGQALDRSLVDASVWQPERVDFAAEPVLGKGLIRRVPEPVLIGSAPLLSTNGIKAELKLGEWRRSSEVLKKAREKVAPQLAEVRKAFVTEHASSVAAQRLNVSEKRLRALWKRAVEDRILTSDFLLHREDGTTVTVGEVLADAEKWHQARFPDPLEPDYRGDKRIAFANLEPDSGFDPYLYSHAHGGMRFRLVREAAHLTLKKGERPRVLDGALSVIRGRGDLFERGGEMVRLTGDDVLPVNDAWLGDYLGRHIRFKEMKFQRGDWVELPADPPNWLCQQLNAKAGERGLRELKGIITAPTLRLDGSILCSPGFDEATGLLLKGSGWPNIPDFPTGDDLHAAFAAIWKPFKEFPFVSKDDRAVMVACVLTATVRRVLSSAPAFSLDAPAAGSGKTLLGKCVMRLSGSPPTIVPECKEEEELRKRLLAALRQGKPCILLDNIRGGFGSAALEGFLTSEHYTDRVLGVSQMLSLPTNVLLLISGNNFHPKGDLYRRIMTARIDAKTDAPERRSFSLDPLEHCREHRQEIVAAVLTLLRGFVVAGKPRTTSDRLASFEDWDDLVRQAVLWIAKKDIADLGDPTACVQKAKDQEPERQKLAAFLETTFSIMGENDWRVADLIKRADAFQMDLQSAALRAALEEIAGERGRINPRILGRWIERYTDTRCAGYYLERRGTKQRAAVWRIRRYGPKIRDSVWPENNSPNSRNSPSFEDKTFADFTKERTQ